MRIDDEAGLAVDHGLVRAAAATGDGRHAARRRLDEHDPVPLGLEAAPPLPAQHGEDVRASVHVREIHFGNPSEERASSRDPTLCGAALEAPGVTAGAADRQLHAGVGPGDGVDQDVEALTRNEAAEPEHEGTVGGEAEPTAHRGAFPRAQGTEPVGVDSGRDDERRELRVGGAGGGARRVLARRDETRRGSEDPPGEDPATGQPSGHVDLGAVRDQNVRRGAEPASDQPERQRRIEEDHIGSPVARDAVDATSKARRR